MAKCVFKFKESDSVFLHRRNSQKTRTTKMKKRGEDLMGLFEHSDVKIIVFCN